MKLLLTSAGIKNDSMKNALRKMLGKDFNESKVIFIPTASVAEDSEHSWFIDEITELYNIGWRELQIVPLNGLPQKVVVERLSSADVIYAIGGSVYHLARSIETNNLTSHFIKLLEEKVYVGSSAGSMVFSNQLNRNSADIFDETNDLTMLGVEEIASPFNLFDWYIKPHLYSKDFRERTDEWLDKKSTLINFPVYAIDDQTAIKVDGDKFEIISEGKWRTINIQS